MKVVVFGATGVVGLSAARYFATLENTFVLGVSRRPTGLAGVEHVPLDLSDRDRCSSVIGSDLFSGTTHAVFAALQESSDLVAARSAFPAGRRQPRRRWMLACWPERWAGRP